MPEREPSPLRRATLGFLLLIGFVAAGIVLGRYFYGHMPDRPAGTGSPAAMQPPPAAAEAAADATVGDGRRLFCAESAETGRCSCITPEGHRPEVPEAECRRRARRSDTAD